jgi:hypothetical protein
MINLGFLTEGKSAAIFITPSSWGSQRAGHQPRIKHIFWRRCRGTQKNNLPRQLGAIKQQQDIFWRRCRGGSRRLLQGEFFVRTSFTLLLFCFNLFIFTCIVLSKTQKN